jgi:hypothetical protein
MQKDVNSALPQARKGSFHQESETKKIPLSLFTERIEEKFSILAAACF